jgi:bifunctional UDP-N-acetylglucosamine pyrophosphorylase/glucosamine-1-phosphate N-acetyltransferase
VVFGPGVTVESGVEIRAFCHLEGCRIGRAAIVGPFARLRPGTVLGARAHVGNFVELKAAQLGEGAKANHLSYLGDAEIGAGSNIGAGTITCNYDGFAKHRTTIGANVFIGSDAVLVAPVTVGDGAFVTAGSVVTEDVAPDAMAFGRARMAHKPGRAAAFRAAHKKPG